jgi:K+ transporter
LIKIVDGGWFPLAFGAVVFMLMLTWKRGRQLLQSRLEVDSIPLERVYRKRIARLRDGAGHGRVHDHQSIDSAPRAVAQHEALQEPA